MEQRTAPDLENQAAGDVETTEISPTESDTAQMEH